MTGPTIVSAPPILLSADELELIRLYRTMDLSEKLHYQESMKWSAEKFPAMPSPRFRLVVGGAS